jgi:hypothetical protein
MVASWTRSISSLPPLGLAATGARGPPAPLSPLSRLKRGGSLAGVELTRLVLWRLSGGAKELDGLAALGWVLLGVRGRPRGAPVGLTTMAAVHQERRAASRPVRHPTGA